MRAVEEYLCRAGFLAGLALGVVSSLAPGVTRADTPSSANRTCPESIPDDSWDRFVYPYGQEKRNAEGLAPTGNSCTVLLSYVRVAVSRQCERGAVLAWRGQKGYVEAENDSLTVRVSFRVPCAELMKRCYDFPQKDQPLAWLDNAKSQPPSCGVAFGPILKQGVCKPGWSMHWRGAEGRIRKTSATNVSVNFQMTCQKVKDLGPKMGIMDKVKSFFSR